MASKGLVFFLFLGLILSFVVENTKGQNLRWGKRDNSGKKYARETRNKRQYNLRWGKRGDADETYAGNTQNKRQNLRWGKREDLSSEFLDFLKQAYLEQKYAQMLQNRDNAIQDEKEHHKENFEH